MAICFAGCKKANPRVTVHKTPEPVQPAEVYADYSPLVTGNYWIYERLQVYPSGSVTNTGETDSTYIEKDTTIRNSTFYKLRRTNFAQGKKEYLIMRDSLHYIIDHRNKILFSSKDFGTLFEHSYNILSPGDTVYETYSRMNDRDLVFKTKAGSFITSSLQTTIKLYPGHYGPNTVNPRMMNSRYAEGVGLVSETEPLFLGQDYSVEKRLIRFHINKN
jgi:hypothetical protein